jgi:serine/threonine protein kinase
MTVPETQLPHAPCPDAAELSAFRLGKLRARELEVIAAHLESCGSCSLSLDSLDEGPDALVHELRRPGGTASPEDADYARALAFAQKLVALPDPAADAAPTLSYVAKLDQAPGLGSSLGQYELLELLGEGGMGRVFKARHRLMDRLVAIKIIKAGLLDSPGSVARFHREIKALARLDHRHIVRALDADAVGGMHFLVMEYIEGKDLSRLVREQGPLPVGRACEYIRQAADGLQHAHEHGLVHRDIKPSNLIVTPTGQVKVLDLGLALLREERSADAPRTAHGAALTTTGPHTTPGEVMGTLDFMAPEQWQDTHRVDIRADLYSLGCTLYYLLAGQAPFSGRAYADPLRKRYGHTEHPVPDLGQFRGDVPAELQAILSRLLAKSPADRYGTPAQVSTALACFLADAAQPPVARPESASGVPLPEPLLQGLGAGHSETGPIEPARLAQPVGKPARGRGVGWRAYLVAALALLVLIPVLFFCTGIGLLLIPLVEPAGRPVGDRPPHQPTPSRTVAEPVRIAWMQITHFRGDPPVNLGSIGELSPGARFGDDVRVRARFSRPCYSYLMAYNPNGKPQLCSPENPDEAPKPLQELNYPAQPTGYFPLNDNESGGLQAFVLAASPRPLESYRVWSRRVGTPPWDHFQEPGVWRFDGEAFHLLTPARGPIHVRGRLPLAVSLLGVDPSPSLASFPWGELYLNRPDGAPLGLVNLCSFFTQRMRQGDALEVIAFPVQVKP